MVDEDGGGTLDIEECATMMGKIAQNFKGVDFDPPFQLGERKPQPSTLLMALLFV